MINITLAAYSDDSLVDRDTCLDAESTDSSRKVS